MRKDWTIADYGNADYVNILDEHGGKVAWQIEREHAERIMAGIALLPPPDDHESLFDLDPDDEDNTDD